MPDIVQLPEWSVVGVIAAPPGLCIRMDYSSVPERERHATVVGFVVWMSAAGEVRHTPMHSEFGEVDNPENDCSVLHHYGDEIRGDDGARVECPR